MSTSPMPAIPESQDTTGSDSTKLPESIEDPSQEEPPASPEQQQSEDLPSSPVSTLHAVDSANSMQDVESQQDAELQLETQPSTALKRGIHYVDLPLQGKAPNPEASFDRIAIKPENRQLVDDLYERYKSRLDKYMINLAVEADQILAKKYGANYDPEEALAKEQDEPARQVEPPQQPSADI